MPAPILSPSTDPLRSLVAVLNRHAFRGDEPDLELGGIAAALSGCISDLEQGLARVVGQARDYRDEARRLDRARPTTEAYEAACRAIESHRELAEAARAKLDAEVSRFHATPREIHEFLLVHLAEDTLLGYQQAIGNHSVGEAVADIRTDADNEQAGPYQSGLLSAIALVDPTQNGGPYPSTLVAFPAVAAGADQ